jgi:hypothetical protein
MVPPIPDPVAVDGAQLLDQIRAALRRYVVLPSAYVEIAVTLWIAATHAAPALYHFPRLVIRSPEKRCGKTRLLDIVSALCRLPVPTANISSAVLYRVMGGKDPRTLLIDEADVIWGTKKAAEANDDLRGLVNSGFERERPTLRYNAATREVEELETFGFVALAGIGSLPDTITDRAVNAVMRRRAAGEKVYPYRSRRDGGKLGELRDRVHDWIAGNFDAIDKAEPELPVDDRAADVWESLVIIADLAGGNWPALARAAAVELSREHDQDDTDANDAIKLLADIRSVFVGASLPSKQLVNLLRGLEDSPWGEYDLTTVGLAAKLRNYKIKPRPDKTGRVRGYRLEDFADAFSRYLAPDPSKDVNSSNPQVDPFDGSDDLTGQGVKGSYPSSTASREFDDLTGSDTCPSCTWPYGSIGHDRNCGRAA